MGSLHRRVIEFIHFNGDLPTFTSKADQQKWLAAIGNLVVYGLEQEDCGHATVDLIQIHVRAKDEMVAFYYNAERTCTLDSKGFTDYTKVQVGLELAEFIHRIIDRVKHKFTLGAILSDKTWGFHS